MSVAEEEIDLRGDTNQNPKDIGLWDLLVEDFRTHGSRALSPGFVAVTLHRLGNARMDISPRFLRLPVSAVYRVVTDIFSWAFGIYLPYNTKVGRRLRIDHYGGIWIGAHAIGDDVHLRHNTTIGVVGPRDIERKPVLGSRIELGVGVCIVGNIRVGDDVTVGANSVVVRDVPPGTMVMGVPARQASLLRDPSP